MAWIMILTPSLPVLAQQRNSQSVRNDLTLLADTAVAPPDLSYMLPQACLVVAARPRQLLTAPAVQMLPVEVLRAASLQHTGVDPLEAEMLLVSIEPPMAGPPNYSVAATFTQPIAGKLHPQLTAHTQPAQLDGREYLKSQHPLMPSIYSPEGTTLLAAPDMTLQKLLAREAATADGLLHERLAGSVSDDLYVAVDLEPLRPLVNQLLMQEPLPEELQFVHAVPDLVRMIELRLNLSGLGPTELLVEANNPRDAKKLLTLLEHTIDIWRDKARAQWEKLQQDPDPVQQALGRYQERIVKQMRAGLMPKQEGAKLIVFRVQPGENEAGALTMVAVSGVLVALLLPAVQAAREAARRNQSSSKAARRNTSMNNMKQILLALLNYQDRKRHFPAHASYDDHGKPLLSWRVHILQELGEAALFKQFHLDEPWDSEHNRKLVEKMPVAYLDPSSKLSIANGRTHYLGAFGEGFMFDPTNTELGFASIRDGSSNTIIVLQVNDQRASPWTKPDDWQFDEQNPLSGLAPGLHPGIFLAGFTDGHVSAISEDVDLEVFRAFLTRDGREVIDLNQ